MTCDKEFNRRLVLEYFDLTFRQQKPDLAAALYLHHDYIHHDNDSKSSREDFILHFLNFFQANPRFKADVLHCLSDHNIVALRVVTNCPESCTKKMVAEFYRVEEGKIKEHWHVVGDLFDHK